MFLCDAVQMSVNIATRFTVGFTFGESMNSQLNMGEISTPELSMNFVEADSSAHC